MKDDKLDQLTCKAFFEVLNGFLLPAVCDLSRVSCEMNTWVVNRLNVPIKARGQGVGRRLMKQLTTWADENQQTLVLFINPSGPMNYEDLKNWYSRNDFEDDDLFEMKRIPKEVR